MYETRIVEESGRTLTVENDDGDRFTFEFPTFHVQNIQLAGPPTWKSGNEPDVAAIWIDDVRHVATAVARKKGWPPHGG